MTALSLARIFSTKYIFFKILKIGRQVDNLTVGFQSAVVVGQQITYYNF